MSGNRRVFHRILFITLAAVWAAPALAGTITDGYLDLAGSASVEVKAFPDNPAFSKQDDVHLSPSIVFEPDIAYEWNGGDDRLTLVPFIRYDPDNAGRSHGDLREALWYHREGNWDMNLGLGKVFWGVTESVHLVDIINQTDSVEGVDGEDKLGQPMVNLTTEQDWGVVSAYVMPYFRDRTVSSHSARLSGGAPVFKEGTYDSDLEEWHPDTAIRWSHFYGDLDVGLSHFHGTSREPRFVETSKSGQSGLRPHYDLIDQTSVDFQLTRGAWLWKLEALTRGGHGDRFAAVVGGFEYTIFGIANTASDLSLLLEYAYDGRDGSAPSVASDNDIFSALRWVANDTDDTEVLGGVIVDRITGELSAFVEANRRFGDAWTTAVEARFNANTSPTSPINGSRNDDFLVVSLTRFF